MGKDRLEHFINKSLGDYESPIDTDELWANIQGATPGTKTVATTGIAAWKWIGLGALALLLLGGIGVFTMTGNSTNAPIADKNMNIEIDSEKETTDVSITESTESITSSTEEEAIVNSNTNDTEKLIELSSISKEEIISKNSSSKKNTVASDQKYGKSQGQYQTDLNDTQIILNSTSLNETPVAIDENIAIDYVESVEVSEQSSSVLGTNFTANTNQWVNTAYAEKSISLLSNENDIENFIGKPDKVTCPSFGNKRGGGVFIGELQLIPYYSNQLIKAEGIEGEEWKSRKEATEKYLEAFQINLIGRYQMNNGLYLQAGIGYGQIDEKFTFNSQDVQVTFEDDLPVIIILRPNGMTDTIRGEVEVTTESTFNAETYNYHRMIELPFAIGYEFNLNNSMGLYVDAGGSINLSTFRTGYHIVDDVDVIAFDDPTRPVFKNSTGFKLNGSIGLRYYTTGGVTLSIGPDIRYHVSNWIGDQHPIEQRYLDLGLRVGIGYAF